MTKSCNVVQVTKLPSFFSPRGNGQLDRRYTNEQLVVPLPGGTTACDIGIFTVWCEPFRATFSRIAIPRSTFVSPDPNDVNIPTHMHHSASECE